MHVFQFLILLGHAQCEPKFHLCMYFNFFFTRAHMQAISPDGQTVVTGAGDETLRFWNVFYKSKSHKVQSDCCFKECDC